MSGEKPFGDVLRGLRQRAGWTIEELAEASGVSVRAIGDMERGHSRVPQRRTVAALADGLGLGDVEHEALLAAVRAGRKTPTVVAAGTVVPPRSVGDFTGRETELARLTEHAEAARTGERAAVTVISGPPGCGKTTLALKAAANLREEFPDGCFMVDLHGVDGPADRGETVLKLLKALGVPERRLAREDAQGQAGLLRALLAERRCLVVLDNARDEGQVRPLLPVAGRSLVVVTSRRPLTGLEDVDRLTLSAMTRAEAVELLRRILGPQRADAEAGAVARVAELCGDLPLALRVAANWLTIRSGWSIGHLVRRLADEERRLGALTAGDVRVEAAFELSYRQLTAQAARMLRLLSLVPGPDMTAAYGAVLTATDLFEAEDVMEELVDAGLLQATFTGRYQLHDLLRLFARARLAREEAGERDAAEEQLNTWLLETAVAAARLFGPGPEAAESSWPGLVPLDTTEQARAWLESEAPAWLATLRGAAARGEHARVAATAEAMGGFANVCAFSGYWTDVYHLSSKAAAALDDPRLRAAQLSMYSWALANEYRAEEAIARADEALEHARRAGDVSQQARAMYYASWPYGQLGRDEQRMEKLRAAADLFEAAGDHEGWTFSMLSYRTSLRELGRAEESLALHERVIAFLDAPDCRLTGHVADLARLTAGTALGRDLAALGRWREAADHLRGDLSRIQQLGVPSLEADVLMELGRVLAELGEIEEARSCLRRALAFGDAADSGNLKIVQSLLESLSAE
ncbi:helix-turn-helix domain-containing protein [Streptomyces sp. NEAU-sy36]|uniref:ATP-binding protein n=1 Tax=unclassified Streptomyces TaxID=2593676 RepID=UPI0015D60E14|nr:MULTISPECIES: helix-turn-helix domain-containing protein [unclassified Streptomyces]QLJ02467.1 helix-turn-helix domain-containing protein [Streptomyces sp. NEAU-sy36]